MIAWQEVLLRLFVSAVLGGLVGLERQRLDWAAGLRTHMIVCIGATLMMIVSVFGFQDVVNTPGIMLDPSRVAAQVVSGIGFLGAGTILFLKNEVIKGLTTAAGLWTVAGIGLAVGGGLYFAATATTALVLIILIIIKPYKDRLISHNKHKALQLQINLRLASLLEIEKAIDRHKLKYAQLSIRPTDSEEINEVTIRFNKSVPDTILLLLIEELYKRNGVSEAKMKNN